MTDADHSPTLGWRDVIESDAKKRRHNLLLLAVAWFSVAVVAGMALWRLR